MPRKVKKSNQSPTERIAIISNLENKFILNNKIRETLEDILGVGTDDDVLSSFESLNLEVSDINDFDKQMLLDQCMIDSARGAIDDVGDLLISYQEYRALENRRPSEEAVSQAAIEVKNAIDTLQHFMSNDFDVFTTQRFRLLLANEDLTFKALRESSDAFLNLLKSVAQQVEQDTAGVSSRGKRNKRCERLLIQGLSGMYKIYLEEVDAFLESHKLNKELRGDDMENEFIRAILSHFKISFALDNRSLNKAKEIKETT